MGGARATSRCQQNCANKAVRAFIDYEPALSAPSPHYDPALSAFSPPFQVARAMLEDKNAVSSCPAPPAALGPAIRAEASLEVLSQLLRFREASLTFQVGSAMRAAAAAHQAGGKAAAEGAANKAFEDNLDVVIAMGWANVERYCLDNFRQVRALSVTMDMAVPDVDLGPFM